MNDLLESLHEMLYSHCHGWAPVDKIIPLLENNGFIITVLEKDGRTDGEIHQRFDYKDQAFDLHANIWVAETFQPLLDWISCCN